jgi:regulator of protease activity HflC (stomatin/prohibitin superfamily)
MEMIILIGLTLSLAFSSLKILREYERAVIFRLGRFTGIRGPGLIILIPGIEQMRRVDLRTVTLDIPGQDIISKDNVTISVNGVVYFRVEDPEKATIAIENYLLATGQIAQTTLRSIVGQFELDDILQKRAQINGELQNILDEQTEPWGVKVSAVELKAIDLPPEMQQAMAKQAQAERDKRAKIISAEAELMAAEKLTQAAHTLSKEENAITLRFLETMKEISVSGNNTTSFFPVPVKLLSKFLKG